MSLVVNLGMWLERFVIVVIKPDTRLHAFCLGPVLRYGLDYATFAEPTVFS